MHDSSTAKFIQGVHEFVGKGLTVPVPLDGCSYTVPAGMSTQPVYFRGGNSSDELICVALMRDGEIMRLFPLGARGASHVSLRVVEDLLGDTVLDLQVMAPEGCAGTLVVDVGLVEI
jgi:hypothetical protein